MSGTPPGSLVPKETTAVEDHVLKELDVQPTEVFH